MVVVASASRNDDESDEAMQRNDREDDLKSRLGALHDCVYRDLCLWLAEDSQDHQEALYDALDGVAAAQDSEEGA